MAEKKEVIKIERISIGKTQLTMLMANAISVKLFLMFPRTMVQTSGTAAWIQSIYVTVLALLIFIGTYKLYSKCGNADIIDLSEHIGGHIMKIVTGVTVSVILCANIGTIVRIFPESIKLYLLPKTPTEFILVFLLTAAAIGAGYGIEAISRLHALIIPICAVIMGLFFLLVLPNCSPDNLLPIMGNGAYCIFVRGFNKISIFSDIIILNLLIPMAESRETAVKCGFWAIVWGGIFAFVITLIYATAYPYPISADFIMPVYQLMRLVKVGEFFQRAEAIFEFVWSLSTMLYISLYICVICMVFRKSFGLKHYKPIIAPIAIIISAVAFMPTSIEILLKSDEIIKNVVYPFAFLLPIVLAWIYNLMKIPPAS